MNALLNELVPGFGRGTTLLRQLRAMMLPTSRSFTANSARSADGSATARRQFVETRLHGFVRPPLGEQTQESLSRPEGDSGESFVEEFPDVAVHRLRSREQPEVLSAVRGCPVGGWVDLFRAMNRHRGQDDAATAGGAAADMLPVPASAFSRQPRRYRVWREDSRRPGYDPGQRPRDDDQQTRRRADGGRRRITETWFSLLGENVSVLEFDAQEHPRLDTRFRRAQYDVGERLRLGFETLERVIPL